MKDDLRNVISRKSEVRNGAIIQTISSYLKRSSRASAMVKDQKHFKKQETEVLKDFITRNNLWIASIDISNYVSEGAEQKVYLNDNQNVIKLNDGIFYNAWEDYLNNILLHNFFFPDTAYNLIGFIFDNETLFTVVKQPFVKATAKTDLQEVKNFFN
jgi:hypothetical protein